MQPIVRDLRGTVRFQENAIVRHLVESCRKGERCDLNDIAMMPFSQNDRIQFAQLIGYSLQGFHELHDVPDSEAVEATRMARETGILKSDEIGGCRDYGCPIHCGVDDYR